MDFSSVIGRTDLTKNKPSSLGGKPIGLKTGDELERVDKELLEQRYASDPILFNTVNKYQTGILSYEGRFVSDDPKEQGILSAYQRQFRLNTVLLPMTVKNLCVYGSYWGELLYGQNTGKLVNIDTRDPKYMDVSKIRQGVSDYPLIDERGNPKYYVQYLKFGQELSTKSREVMQCNKRAIKFEPEEIIKIDLFTLGDSFDGLGIIEPLFQAAINKEDVEKAITQAILKIGNPVVYGHVGDERHEPTKQLIDEWGNVLQDINERTGFALPYYVEPKILQAKGAEKLTENAIYYVDQVVAGTGLPKTLATGTGEGSNKHTLEGVMQFLGGTFLMIRNNIAEAYNQQVLPKIAEMEGLNDARFEWRKRIKEVGEDEQNTN